MGSAHQKSMKATWSQAILTLLSPILVVLMIRWMIVEPFVVPSGSMIPTLRIHDHILANKYAYGLHIPFSKKWLIRWSAPKRWDIAVFRYPNTPDVYYVKRIVGLPGDELSVEQGTLKINNEKVALVPIDIKNEDKTFEYFHEINHTIRYSDKLDSNYGPIKIPEGQYFAMGDNRDQSSDSRVWGFVPEENLVGAVSWIWLSCEYTLASAQFLCDPRTILWERLFKRVGN